MNLLKRLLWLSGRVGRLEFFLIGIIIWNICGGWPALNFFWLRETDGEQVKIAELAQFFGTPLARFLLYVWYAALWIAVANNFKRLHDLGWSGFWQFVPVVAIYCWGEFVGSIGGDANAFSSEHPARLLTILVFGFGGWVAILLGSLFLAGSLLLRRGQAGDNAYGASPQWPNAKAATVGVGIARDPADR